MHKHRTGASSLAVVAALTLALAGCSGGGEESPPSEASESAPAAETTPTPTPTPEPTPEPVATPLTPEQAWDQSLCAALDTATLEAVTGRVYHGGEVSGANSQLPINDRCTVFLLDPATAETTPDVATITFGVSAATVDAAGWQRISDTYAATLGTYLTITPLEVADGGFAVFEGSRAWAHAGDRVVYVSDTSQSGLSTDAYPTLLAAAAAAAATLPEATPILTHPDCEALVASATTVLGTKPTIQRTSGEGASCIFGESERVLSSSRTTMEQAAADVAQFMADSGTPALAGLGEIAAWSDNSDGSFLIWAQGDQQYHLTTSAGFNADQAAMLAMAAEMMALGG